ncbi:MAG: hypothetical protein ACOYNY_40010 [Caldilineaceae bacterium]
MTTTEVISRLETAIANERAQHPPHGKPPESAPALPTPTAAPTAAPP